MAVMPAQAGIQSSGGEPNKSWTPA